MSTNLAGAKIRDTFAQLMHLDGGPAAEEKTLLSGAGASTALKVGTDSVSVDNIRIDGNTISSLDPGGNIALAPNGAGSVSIAKVAFTDAPQARTALGLGDLAVQNGDNVTITGGSISGVSFSGTFDGITSIDSISFSTSDELTNLTISGNNITAGGTDTNVDIDLVPQGVGLVNIPRVNVDSGFIDNTTIGTSVPADGWFTTSLATEQVGYTTGNGGTVTQLTSRTTGVTLDAPSGQITLVAASISGLSTQEFTLTNSYIGATDVVLVSFGSGLTSAQYDVTVTETAAGSCKIAVHNVNNSATAADTPVINFVIFKGVNA